MPVVGAVSPEYTLTLNPDEVADTFEVPLSFLMNPARHELHSREWKGRVAPLLCNALSTNVTSGA